MDNLQHIKSTDKQLYEKLKTYTCEVSYNGSVLYSGTFDENLKFDKDETCIVVKFLLENNKQFICLLKENKNIEKLKSLTDNFDDILEDSKLYNRVILLSLKLPLYNICEDTRLKSDPLKKIYENLYL